MPRKHSLRQIVRLYRRDVDYMDNRLEDRRTAEKEHRKMLRRLRVLLKLARS